jgi:hypothetical protein
MTPFVSVARGVCVLVLGASAFVPSSVPQDAPKTSGVPSLQRFTEGLTVGDLLATWTAETGRKFVVREEGNIRQRRLTLTGPPQYASGDADFLFESMLQAGGLVLSAAGPADAKLFVVEDVAQSPGVKSRAAYVHPQDVRNLFRSPAQVFMTAFPLKHLKADQVRNAVSQILVSRNVEYTMEVPSANALIVVGLGPTVTAIGNLLSSLDVPGAKIAESPPEKEGGEKK